ncbi:alpha-glucan family phosphorylase [Plantibacter sp. YIM 135347]|uniref:alpha-glucan family phosphorylase n=1 Tax=Plantibacter sp. YIM 135347 TaxID=3423919 RepID=UPI003D33E7DD
MKAIRRFTVRAVIPEQLMPLAELAANLRWSWHEPTQRLFAEIEPEVWRETDHDPISGLGLVTPERLAELAADDGFVERARALREDLREYLREPRWYQSLPDPKPASIAYFSPEFGIASALPQYSGGLGILAGDHLKSASDLGVPLVGVGLLYRSGYFAQSLTPDGWQQETYPVQDPDGLPLTVLREPDGTAVTVTLALPDDRTLNARVWIADVGRVPLLLLDTDIPENADGLRFVTDRLYGGSGEHRLLQELLLGIGGVRAIKRWAELHDQPVPQVFHTNEGHAGFLGLERISDLIGIGLSFEEAVQVVRAGTVFTTHTPVPAGIDRFDRALIERYFTGDLLPGVGTGDVLALGDEQANGGSGDVFNMAMMGLRLAQRANGVSKLHGAVSREMFKGLWPGFDVADIPITSVTNGVHAPTWTASSLVDLAASTLGTPDTTNADWASPALSDHALWALRRRMRAQLVEDVRRRVAGRLRAENPTAVIPPWINELLDPDVLTIGFARRVPTYKRLTLMLRDPERLRRLLLDPDRPIQIVVAGKSHPADDEGKRLIQQLVQFSQDPELRTRMVFLPDYGIGMAKNLYPGCDVWLNNPLRPLEACGTSGMKAALNGALNLSILDGWWDEFSDGENGWAIPTADGAANDDERDDLEAGALYEMLEHQLAPRFYDRDESGMPTRWMRRVRHTITTLSAPLSADRMVREYVERMYVPAGAMEATLTASDASAARDLASYKARVRAAWPQVAVVHVESGGVDEVPQVGDVLRLRAYVQLGQLTPADVSVEVVSGVSEPGGELTQVRTQPLVWRQSNSTGSPEDALEYEGSIVLDRAGGFGYTVRVVPQHELLIGPAELGLIAVASA